jgi:DNA-directed RNA polymerase specialized sigma24 family protein
MVYFTQDTEDAIVKYNNEYDPIIKSKIYERKIHYPFFKLTENIVHTFKFYYTEVENIEDLQHEVITFLLSKIHLFDPSKGAKAYSYFGTIAKRYLILSNQKNYKKRLDTIPVEEIYEDENHSYELEENYTNDKISDFMDMYVDFCTKNIFKLFPKEADARVADAILELFRKRDHLTIFNKKALYIYIREQIDVKTPKITKVANHLYKLYKSHYLFYEENGYMKV